LLVHAYAVTPEDSDVHAAIGERLASLQAIAQRDATNVAQVALDARRKRELPHLTRGLYRLLGPRVDADRCAGLVAARDPACARGWSDALGLAAPDLPGAADARDSRGE
jgi:hypothetical protein